ncbi:hypothetical protein BGZ65_005435 [Modicella reniformis]|uniref:IPT/TIG domain-containing protein n=1 Tax=Modicella reniformis TaxID=1440133 RepID=A0A9P6JHW8_9FUNG|nr:hypothetical protein BGZ65_005435 [Modicella reniformis]
MYGSTTNVDPITSAAHLSFDSTNSPTSTTSPLVKNRSPQLPAQALTRGPQERYPDAAVVRREPGNPQCHSNLQQEQHGLQHSVVTQSPKDAWADQGHFPLLLGEVSCKSISVRGGSHVILSGMNFREGVEVVFACPQLGKSDTPKVVRPRILKNTEMDLVSPNILDWWVLANSIRPCRELGVSITLVCAGAKDIDTTFQMSAVEDSEIELLHVIIRLHRQVIQTNLNDQQGVDPDTKHAAKQRTMNLLSLERPPSVTPSEHLALGIMFMLCDFHDRFSPEGMEIILAKTQDGHDMLHLAALQGQTTLVREIARHLLTRFQAQAMSESAIFCKNPNGDTAIDFARSLGHMEIVQVLTSTLEAAQEFKTVMLQTPKRPLPTLPTRRRTESVAENTGSQYSTAIFPAPAPALARPLPPTPTASPYNEPEPNSQQPLSYFPTVSSAGTGKNDSSESLATVGSSHPPVQRIQTVQAIVEEEDVTTEPLNTVFDNPPTYTNYESSTDMLRSQPSQHTTTAHKHCAHRGPVWQWHLARSAINSDPPDLGAVQTSASDPAPSHCSPTASKAQSDACEPTETVYDPDDDK